RRNPDLEPNVTLTVEGDNLTLHIDAQWLEKNPLTAAELEIESNRQTDIGWPLNIVAK
ncbi:guanosine-5'-triphosphate,3'-diphosphate pyrophosphatase, partial [Vibrio parahaemolyticus]|nr:guanosine-5'-triphosphate,3'-diphosphate pyrophosphatase [Vibrio parahaemolyticus]